MQILDKLGGIRGDKIWGIIIPVSYTHLDVYKRQAQALVEGITLLTSDAVVAQYPGPVRKV